MAVNNYMNRKGNRAATAMIMRNQYARQFGIQYYLIVEGESDQHFFEVIINCEKCKIMSLEGKDNVKNFVSDRNKRKEKGYLGIVDADFEHISGYDTAVDNVILTDLHDIEMMILSSKPDMKRIYSELSDNLTITEYEKTSKESFLESVLKAAYEIGLLKLVMCKPKYKINMDDIPYEDLVNKKFEVDIDELIKRIIHQYHSVYEIKEEIEEERKKEFDLYQVCCGHDVSEIMCRSFISRDEGGLGYGKNKYLAKNRIEELLRVIYIFKHFATTKLFSEILNWEEKNNVEIINKSVLA